MMEKVFLSQVSLITSTFSFLVYHHAFYFEFFISYVSSQEW